MSLEKRLQAADEHEAQQPKWYSQWAWKRFLENLLLFAMLFGMVSFMITYVVAISVFHADTMMAMVYTMIHLVISGGLFIGDIICEVVSVSGKLYLRGTWYDSSNKVGFGDVEIADIKPLEIDEMIASNPHGPTLVNLQGKEMKWNEYNNYVLSLVGCENPMRIIMVPKPFTIDTALTTVREAVCIRYPVPARVAYATFTQMLTPTYEDSPLPIYELTFSMGMVAARQALLPWFAPKAGNVTKALKDFDLGYGTKWRMKAQTATNFNEALLELVQDLRHYGHTQADEITKTFERTMGEGTGESSIMSWFRRHTVALCIVGGIAVVLVVVFVWLIPALSANNPGPPSMVLRLIHDSAPLT
jgi:hypothetical protein